MTKRLIGIEITAQHIRMAICANSKEQPEQFITLEQPINHGNDESSGGNLGEQLIAMLGTHPGFADRLCCTLSARDIFTRQLSFPFNDTRKIRSAARMELAAQLPVDISNYIVSTSSPSTTDQGTTVRAIAADTSCIGTALQPFEEVKLPLHLLGASPYTEACGLNRWFTDGFLVQLHHKQLLITLIQQGQAINFEHCGCVDNSNEELVQLINTKTTLMLRSARLQRQPLCLIGDNVSTTLRDQLTSCDHQLVQLPIVDNNSTPVEPAFLPVCARAMAAGQKGVNLRLDQFTMKNEWSALKKHLYTGGIMLLLAAIVTTTTAIRTYRHKTEIAQSYRQQITQLFHQTLPQAKVIVDIPRQLQLELNHLRETAQLIGLDKSSTALAILRAISTNTPADIKLDIKKFNYDGATLALEGNTNSFDSVNRWADELGKIPIFNQVRITDAKMGLDGKQVTFRLQISIGNKGE